MIVVTGGTGQLGHAVILNLLRFVPAADIVASVRQPDKASALAIAAWTSGTAILPIRRA